MASRFEMKQVVTIFLTVTSLVVVFLWTVICLAIAAHFQSLLVINELSERPLKSIRILGSCGFA